MIQSVMIFVLGLLSAGVVVLLVTPAIWRRAQRLTRIRVESSVPMTLGEIQAEKDQLRAEFAMASRRMEMNIEKLRGQNAEQTVEIHHKREEITRLTAIFADSASAIQSLEARAAALAETLAATQAQLASTSADLAEREKAFNEQIATLATVTTRASGLQQLSDEQKLELVARNTEIANLGDVMAALRASERSVIAERDALAATLADERAALSRERERAAGLEAAVARLEAERDQGIATLASRNAEIATLERELTAGRAAGEALAAEIAGLKAEIERRGRESEELRGALGSRIAETEGLWAELALVEGKHAGAEERLASTLAEAEKLKAELAGQQRGSSELEARLLAALEEIRSLEIKIEATAVAEGDNARKAIAATEAENEALVKRLAALEDDYAALRAENIELHRIAGDREGMRSENALLRDHLARIAADVVRMAEGMSGAQASPPTAGDGEAAANWQDPSPPQPDSPHEPAPAEATPATERLRVLQQTGSRH